MPQFLPKTAGEAFEVTRQSDGFFVDEKQSFLLNVARKVAVDDAGDDQGRTPSILSRAYSFYTDLFPGSLSVEGATTSSRIAARERATRQFRGIVSLLALRGSLGLDLRLKSFTPAGSSSIPSCEGLHEVLKSALAEAPGFDKPVWRASIRYLVNRLGEREEPLCGLSPYTLFFPAAKRLTTCRQVFWYHPSSGRWLDPTSDWERERGTVESVVQHEGISVDYDLIKWIRGHLVSFIQNSLDERFISQLGGLGIDHLHADQIRALMAEWLQAMQQREFVPVVAQLVPATFGLLQNDQSVPILEQANGVALGGQEDFTRRVLTGLPVVTDHASGKVRILLSKEILSDPKIRVCGTLMGKSALEVSLVDLPLQGDRFTIRDGDTAYHVDLPFLNVEKIFLDQMHLLSQEETSKNFFGLKGAQDEYWLFPLHENILNYIDLDHQQGGAHAGNVPITASLEGSGKSREILVTLKLGSRTFTKSYATDKRKRVVNPGELDVRIWPNFRFADRSDQPPLPPKPADRTYHLRVRQHPNWKLETDVLVRIKSNNSVHTVIRRVSPDAQIGSVTSESKFGPFRMARYYRLQSSSSGSGGVPMNNQQPVGFSFRGTTTDLQFQEWGFCLLRLAAPHDPGERAAQWRVGIDFGTTNTCVCLQESSGGTLEPITDTLLFRIRTDSLHKIPTYTPPAFDPPNKQSEGAAAVVDFPYKYDGTENAPLTLQTHFPSQFVTRQDGEIDDGEFRIENGLLFPRNATIDSNDISSVLKLFPLPQNTPFDQRVHRLYGDIKWSNSKFRKAFLWHLYKLVTLEAAARGAAITGATFSFPRAFTRDQVSAFRAEVLAVFSAHGGVEIDSTHDFVSESDAVGRWMARHPDRNSHIILDVGGGTVDYLGIRGRTPSFQCSYKFAGRYVNKFFAKSRVFRDRFKEVVLAAVETATKERSATLFDRLLPKKTAEGGCLDEALLVQAFFGLLGMVTPQNLPEILSHLKGLAKKQIVGASPQLTEDVKKSTRGFFLTLVLLYGGMAYQAGRLLKKGGEQESNLQIDLIGNGSRFYHYLRVGDKPFDPILCLLFNLGYQSNTQLNLTVKFQEDGKSFVARGLLEGPAEVEVAPVTLDKGSLEEFNARLRPNSQMKFNDIDEFLGGLSNNLPGGKFQQNTVIPFCVDDIRNELSGLVLKTVDMVKIEELENARRHSELLAQADQFDRSNNGKEAELRRSEAAAIEPPFITRLGALLDVIRDEYAV